MDNVWLKKEIHQKNNSWIALRPAQQASFLPAAIDFDVNAAPFN